MIVAALAHTYADDSIQPIIGSRRRLEKHRLPKIVLGSIDGLAFGQTFENRSWSMAQASSFQMDDCTIIGLKRHAHVEFGSAISAQKLKICSARKQVAREPFSRKIAAQDRNMPALTMRTARYDERRRNLNP